MIQIVQGILGIEGKIRTTDILKPLMDEGLAEELMAVFNKNKVRYARGGEADHWLHLTANYSVKDSELTQDSTHNATLVFGRRIQAVTVMLLKVAFSFYKSRLARPGLVIYSGHWLNESVHRTADQRGTLVVIDCTYTFEELPYPPAPVREAQA